MPSHSACNRSAAKALRRLARNDLAATGAIIEIFEDHPRIRNRRVPSSVISTGILPSGFC